MVNLKLSTQTIQEPVKELYFPTLPIRGWPGVRNRPGRCGLDYLDTTAEQGHKIIPIQPAPPPPPWPTFKKKLPKRLKTRQPPNPNGAPAA
jgi:hypothetical protein